MKQMNSIDIHQYPNKISEDYGNNKIELHKHNERFSKVDLHLGKFTEQSYICGCCHELNSFMETNSNWSYFYFFLWTIERK